MRPFAVLFPCVAALTLAACASGGTPAPTITTNEPVPAAGWSGNLQPTQQRTGSVAVTGQIRAFGTVSIVPASGSLERMHIALSVAVPTMSAQSMRWAVLTGRCGSGDLALGSFDQYPLLEISSNGRGQIETELPLTMESGGTYHVNIYSGGQQLDNVVTCANLRFNGAPGGR